MTDPQDIAVEDRDDLDGLYGATDTVVREVKKNLAESRRDAVAALIEPLHAADIADLLEQVDAGHRREILLLGADQIDGEVLSELHEDVRREVMQFLPDAMVAEAVREAWIDRASGLETAAGCPRSRLLPIARAHPPRFRACAAGQASAGVSSDQAL